ncbi:MerR family DNA-binding transcriptional regulator [candidate division WWE3 bacterium]|nr:MerR family DNA-binding transcriptional regulator [candidate division WWE3 bacterium]
MKSSPAQIKHKNYSKESSPYLNVSKAAKLLGVSPTTLRRFEAEGKIISERGANGYRQFKLDDVRLLQSSQSSQATAAAAPLSKADTTIVVTPKQASTPRSPVFVKAKAGDNLTKGLKLIVKANQHFSRATAITAVLALVATLTAFGIDWRARPFSAPSVLGGSLAEKIITDDTILKIFREAQFSSNVIIPSLSGVAKIDTTTASTFEDSLSLSGDIGGTLSAAEIAENVIGDKELADEIDYSGTLNITGAFELDGDELTAEANDLNTLADNTDELSDFADITIAGFLRSDTSDQYTSGTLSLSDGTFLDLSSIKQDDTAAQGLKLPQNTALTALSSTAGEGFLAWDSTTNQLQVFNGTSWSSNGIGHFTDGGTTTYLTSTTDDLALGGSDSTASFFFDVSGPLFSLGGTSPTIQFNNTGTLTITDSTNTLITIADAGTTGNLTVTGNTTITGTEGVTSLTLSSGDMTISDGSLALTDDDNATSLSVTNNVVTTNTQGLALFSSTSLTTGTLLNLALTEANLTTGYYLKAYDNTAAAAVFTIAEDGVTTIAGTAQGSPALTLTAGDLIVSSGNAGIGTTNPQYRLEVSGAEYVGGTLTAAGHILPSSNNTYDLGSNAARWRDLYLGPNTLHIGTSTSDEYTVSFNTAQNFLGFNLNGSGNDDIVFNGSGNVGVGTTSPSSAIDIVGDIELDGGASSDLYIDYRWGSTDKIRLKGEGTTSDFIVLYNDGTAKNALRLDVSDAEIELFPDNTGGQVGVGTAAPNATLHLSGGSGAIDILRLQSSYSAVGHGAAITWQDSSNDIAKITSILEGTSQVGLALSTYNTTIAERVRISATGNVGVGTTAPGYRLDVGGTGRYTGGVTLDSTLGVTGTTTLSGTLDANGQVDLGDSGDTVSIASSDWAVSTAGALTGISGITNDGGYTQSGTSANTFTGTSTFSNATYSALFTGGNVGIGTTNPLFKLDVAGDIGPDANNTRNIGSPSKYFANGYITNLYGGSSGAFGYWNRTGAILTPLTAGDTVATTGNVGVGTTTPRNALDVSGSAAFGSLPTAALPIANSAYFSGNVGIGITAPSQQLTVNANAIIGSSTATTETLANSGFSLGGDDLFVAGSAGVEGNVYSDGSFIAGASTTISNGSLAQSSGEILNIRTTSANLRLEALTSGDIILFPNSGNVGVGTSGPLNKLDVSGSAAIGSLPTTALPQANSFYVSGNVGIGTTNPSQKLDIAGSLNLSSGSTYKIAGTDVLSGTTLGSGVTASSLTSVGTIGTGIWQGTSVKTGYGGTGVTAYTAGDILYYASGTALTNLAIGSVNYVLTSTGSAPSWTTISGSSITADSLDFTEFRDAMSLDASTSINLAGLPVLTSPDLIFR